MCPGGPWPPGHSLPPGLLPDHPKQIPHTRRLAQTRSVLVDVIAMLEVAVAVAVMDVVHMIAMGGRLTAVSFGVRARVTGVHRLLGVVLLAVQVIDVVVVLDRLAPVTRMVLVIDRFSVRGHLTSSPSGH